MRSLKYLNSILTILTVLLALQLWTMWTMPAGNWDHAQTAQAQGLANTGAQRKDLIDQTKLLTQKVEQLTALFKTGKARVQVDNLDKGDKDKD